MHAHTPHLTVSDPRGLTVRSVDYCRVVPGSLAELRVQHARFDARGRQVEQRDPRLWALPQAPANLTAVHSLSGQVLASEGVDDGMGCSLSNEAGQVVRQWDGRGSQRVLAYDELQRPVAVFERLAGQPLLCSERHIYADGSAEHAAYNRCGRLLRHDDPAGTHQGVAFSLTGEASSECRRFLASNEWPDWPETVDARDALLEPGEGASTDWRHGPLGEVLEQVDAGGHRQRFTFNLSGELRQIGVQVAGHALRTVLNDARYSASGKVLEERLGNGVTIRRTYRAQDYQLLSLVTCRDTGDTLQDLHYSYDPAGNLTSQEDRAQPVRYFANQRIEPRCDYRYDSLYQLIEATGWEAGAANRGPGSLSDPQARANYRQTYRYDAGGNLLELIHVGAQSHGRILTAARHSNRCLEMIDGHPPGEDDFLQRFDANGNLLELQPGRRLHWDVRSQLSEVHPVTREGATNDTEHYHYDAAGQRVRKGSRVQMAGRSLHREVRYLPSLEVHDRAAAAERFQVIVVQAGTCGLRVLHWLAGQPDEMPQDQHRYGLTDHLGSSTLELDASAALISHELYYPFGDTAWWAGQRDVEAGYKTVRYSGKERDATGLYYYGARYYVPWLQRWLNADPAGAVEGLNLFRMVRNNPLTRVDPDGRDSRQARARWAFAIQNARELGTPVSVRQVVPGILLVRIRASTELFQRMGFDLENLHTPTRRLSYLSIGAGYKGKIAGQKDAATGLYKESPLSIAQVAKTHGRAHTAYINGGYFDEFSKAPIGDTRIDGKSRASLPVPGDYKLAYQKLKMDDGSFIHTAPGLVLHGRNLFPKGLSKNPLFQFDTRTNHPGWLGHAEHPNPRSAIALPKAGDAAGRVRLAVGLNVGRSDDRGATASGYTMSEWANVMMRLDRINGQRGLVYNLDGGSSSMLGVVSGAGESVVKVQGWEVKSVSNFVAYYTRRS